MAVVDVVDVAVAAVVVAVVVAAAGLRVSPCACVAGLRRDAPHPHARSARRAASYCRRHVTSCIVCKQSALET